MGRLANKVAVITGALGGQGQVAVSRFSDEGASIVASDLAEEASGSVADLCRAQPDRCVYVGGDVCSPKVREAMIEAAVSRFERLDILFNNHGIIVGKTFLDTTTEDLDQVLSVNLRAPFLLSQIAARAMAETGGGSIIHNSSVGGLVGFPKLAAYGAAKGGLVQLARGMATDLASSNIRVNTICPGVVDTPMPRRYVGDVKDKDAIFEAMAEMHLLKRFAQPDEIINVVVFLASDEASFVTGTVIPIDGGLTAI